MNKKNRFSGPKRLNRLRLWPIGQPVEEPVDQLRSSDRGSVEEGQKPSLSPSSLLFPVEVPSRTSRGPVEATITCHALNAPTASEPVNP